MTIIVPERPITNLDEVQAVRGVEIVLGVERDVAELLTPLALKLMGGLQRRLFDRHQAMVQHRALQNTSPAEPFAAVVSDAPIVADLSTHNSWSGRLEVADRVRHHDGVVRVRGWSETENGVLVDGRPVLAPVFDVAISLAARVRELRTGISPMIVEVPVPADLDASRLWAELVRVAEDRLGVERGTVAITSKIVSA